MTPPEIEALLQTAFWQCENAACPLSDLQKQTLRQVLIDLLTGQSTFGNAAGTSNLMQNNPLDQLTAEERHALLKFVKQQESQNRDWKITLLNDWLQGRDSDKIQFIRERYGIQWLHQIQPAHLAMYNEQDDGEVLQLKVGDRIEVTNGLWEWVQEEGPCSREWFPCTVIQLNETSEPVDRLGEAITTSQPRPTTCVVRFENGAEYEIQGVYDWNRPNWRWIKLSLEQS